MPLFFSHDASATVIGQGEAAFAAGRSAFERWSMFDLGWVRVANPDARIAMGQLVAVEVKSLRLWTVNLSQIVEVVETPNRFSFVYATTHLHVEHGEERFLLDFDVKSRNVTYSLDAISRPRSLLAKAGFPITRMFQHRFARDSHRRMREVVQDQTH